MTEPTTGRRVLVTGASTGIGRATVRELDRLGWTVLATVRREEDAEGLRQESDGRVEPVLMDLTDEGSVRGLTEVLGEQPLHSLVNNAGAALAGPLEYLPIEVFRRHLDVNLVGQLLVTQVCLPALRRAAETAGDARIVMIGSIGGRFAGPMLGAYSAAKHGLAGLSTALRAELAPTGIKVLLVEPGAIATPIWGRGMAASEELTTADPRVSERYGAQLRAASRMAERGATTGLDPSAVAKVVLGCLTDRRPVPRQTVGRDAAVLAALLRVLPFRTQYWLQRSRA